MSRTLNDVLDCMDYCSAEFLITLEFGIDEQQMAKRRIAALKLDRLTAEMMHKYDKQMIQPGCEKPINPPWNKEP